MELGYLILIVLSILLNCFLTAWAVNMGTGSMRRDVRVLREEYQNERLRQRREAAAGRSPSA